MRLMLLKTTKGESMLSKLSDADYFGHKAVSQSNLKEILKSPAHYRARLEEKQVTTPAMILGSAIHAAILEPEIFDQNYTFIEMDKRTKQFKEFQEANKNKIILNIDDRNKIEGIRNSCLNHGIAKRFFEKTDSNLIEQAGFWECQEVKCKGKFDVVNIDARVCVDLKTTESANEKDFIKSIINFKYDFQAAFYSIGLEKIFKEKFDFIFVAVEKTPPYAVNLFELDSDALWKATDKVNESLLVLKSCLESNEFPSYPPLINKITLPKWSI